MMVFEVNWASYFTLTGYMPINIPGRGKFEDSSEPPLLSQISMLLPPWGFMYTLTAPRRSIASKDLARSLGLAAASDKCWALSLTQGRDCLAAAWACFPQLSCQSVL